MVFSVDVFSSNKSVSWMGYSLDNQQNITLTTNNSTIANVTSGLHSITVYANDAFGNMGASETITFTIEKPEPFPVLVTAVFAVAALVVGVVLIVYFIKHRQKTQLSK